jgi:hypothetical protein
MLCVLGFLTRFPQFRSHPLILASESYGGHCKTHHTLQVHASLCPLVCLLSSVLKGHRLMGIGQAWSYSPPPSSLLCYDSVCLLDLPTLAHRIVTEQAKLNNSDPDHKLNFRVRSWRPLLPGTTPQTTENL